MQINQFVWKITYLVTGEFWTNKNEKQNIAHERDALYELALHRFQRGVCIIYMDMDNIAFCFSRLDNRLTAVLLDECGHWDELPADYLIELSCPICDHE